MTGSYKHSETGTERNSNLNFLHLLRTKVVELRLNGRLLALLEIPRGLAVGNVSRASTLSMSTVTSPTSTVEQMSSQHFRLLQNGFEVSVKCWIEIFFPYKR